ncbi:MAG: 7-carboxy-7-deazaguanine synthase QueE [Flavobacteriaceae bacterium]|tara:strand:+ start:7752 stop:8384 length:633 start_codon:yes stop_codon:yes gene_type:complete
MNQNLKKIKVNNGKFLPLMETFTTIQGEGFHSGKLAHFLRIGGCDIGCHWCDIKESWNSDLYPLTKVEKIIERIDPLIKLIVISGGEPLTWNMSLLTNALKKRNKKVHLETSGAYELSGYWDWICLSPKKNKLPVPELYKRANELKIIIYNKHDLIFAKKNAKYVKKDCNLFLQPEWSKKEKVMPLISKFMLENPNWRLSLQTHKYLGVK